MVNCTFCRCKVRTNISSHLGMLCSQCYFFYIKIPNYIPKEQYRQYMERKLNEM